MKKYILIIILSIVSLSAFAKPPKLNVDKLFDGSYSSNPSVSVIISQSPEKYFRGFTVTDNKAIVDKVTKLFEKDLPRATSSQEIISSGSRYRTMHIPNNGEDIYIGISYTQDTSCYLFITCYPKAYK